ncbi:MAG: hypothetical protein M9939_10475 [Mesorhizobium sp.]|nr:hypothetical protein [Mesorhizobium sp.]MCO5161552.1 hypothetical protein [Mesorhizobium sp.]
MLTPSFRGREAEPGIQSADPGGCGSSLVIEVEGVDVLTDVRDLDSGFRFAAPE